MSFLKHASLALLIAFNHSSVFASQEASEFNIKLTDYSAGINNDLCANAQVNTQHHCFHTIRLPTPLAQVITEQTSRKSPIPANDWLTLNELLDFTQSYHLMEPIWFDKLNAAYGLNRGFNDHRFEETITQNKLSDARNTVNLYQQQLESQHMMSAYMSAFHIEQTLQALKTDFMYSSPLPKHDAIAAINELEQQLNILKINTDLMAYDEINAPIWVEQLNLRLSHFSNAVNNLPDNQLLIQQAVMALNAAYPLNMHVNKEQLTFDAILLHDVSPHPIPAATLLDDLNIALTQLEQALAKQWLTYFSQSLPAPTSNVQISLTLDDTDNKSSATPDKTQLIDDFISVFKKTYTTRVTPTSSQ
ncbi:hypothetical protein [uncultured Shewanella sp.]|uniref:hypothetical protein n=1 Tax=uncultured Shewanella sp. TaxID=173975 RepID=UPI00261986BA|nr:hypothetical protein [uncultured Shewanella sp.]